MSADDIKTHRLDVLAALVERLKQRAGQSPDESYTARLLSEGRHKCAKKLGEEGVELALAVVDGSKQEVRAEAADVIYHLLVALMARDVPLQEVMTELEGRFALSGLQEKARRNQPRG